jgi:hypothetical protein
LEFIPWDDLRVTEAALPNGKRLWRPKKHVAYDHHLRTEEEVFKYCVEADLFFPGYSEEDAIVFESSPLRGSKLIIEMEDFWEKWVRM